MLTETKVPNLHFNLIRQHSSNEVMSPLPSKECPFDLLHEILQIDDSNDKNSDKDSYQSKNNINSLIEEYGFAFFENEGECGGCKGELELPKRVSDPVIHDARFCGFNCMEFPKTPSNFSWELKKRDSFEL